MAKATYGANRADFNTPPFLSLRFSLDAGRERTLPLEPNVFEPRDVFASARLLTPTTRRLLLERLAVRGWATLSQLTAAIPVHPRPISAVRALVDCGLAELDEDRPFGCDMVLRLASVAD